MKRDEVLSYMKHVRQRLIACDEKVRHQFVDDVIAWLERLPEGCELVGMLPNGAGTNVLDFDVPRGKSFHMRTWWVNPDDLARGGGKR